MSKAKRLQALSDSRAHHDVALGYVHPDQVDAAWHTSMMQLQRHDLMGPRRLFGEIHIGSGPRIAHSRNMVVSHFLGTSAEWLLMIDTDMVFGEDLLDRLLEVADPEGCPIVGGLCFSGGKTARVNPTLYVASVDDDGLPVVGIVTDYPRDTLVQVDATGAACLLVHRSVYEKLHETWGEKTVNPWFAETEHAMREFGEDITFCMRARQAGFPIRVHTGIQVGHRKTHILSEDTFTEQQLREQAGTQEEFERRHFEALGLLEKAA